MTTMSVKVRTANLDFALDGDRKYLERLCKDADVLLVQEAKDRILSLILPEGWVSLQETTTEALRGSAICYRAETMKARSHGFAIGSRPFIRSRRIGMLDRWIARAMLIELATGRRATFISAHFPPSRFAILQPGYERRLRGVVNNNPGGVVIGTDANQPIGRLASRLGLDGYGRGIVGLITNLTVTGEKVEPWGIGHEVTDHPSVSATIHLRKAQP